MIICVYREIIICRSAIADGHNLHCRGLELAGVAPGALVVASADGLHAGVVGLLGGEAGEGVRIYVHSHRSGITEVRTGAVFNHPAGGRAVFRPA